MKRAGQLVVVADHLYSARQLRDERWLGLLTEFVKGVIASRGDDDRLVGIIGPSSFFNAINAALLDDEDDVPQGPGLDAEAKHRLREMTVERGYVAGYHGAVAGSNDFADDRGRFVSPLLVFGPPILPLDEWGVDMSCLYAGQSYRLLNFGTLAGVPVDLDVLTTNQPVDTRVVRASVPFPEYRTDDGEVIVANNIPMPADGRLAELAWEAQAGRLEQSLGRSRLNMPANAESITIQFGAYPTSEPPDEILPSIRDAFGLLGIDLPFDYLDLVTDGRVSNGGKRAGAGRRPRAGSYEEYARHRRRGLTHAEVVSKLGVARRTAYRWRGKFDEEASVPNQSP